MNERNTEQSQWQSPLEKFFRTHLLESPEGHIFLTGLGVGLLYLFWIGMNGFWDVQRLQILVAMTATHVLFGRAAGVSFGLATQLDHLTILATSMIIESIVLLLFYPLFVFSWRHLLVLPTLKKMMSRMHTAAEKHRQFIKRYGLLGLFAFVWFPFWMTGSLVGCVIGFLLELKPWSTIGVVLGAAYSAILSWVFLLQHVHEHFAGFSPHTPFVILAILIAIAVLGYFIQRRASEK